MRVALVHGISSRHQIEACDRIRKGMLARGDEVSVHPGGQNMPAHFDVVATWGWRVGQQYRAKYGKPVLVMERGYIADRFTWTSLGWNGLNGRATFPLIDDAGARFWQHFRDRLKPWKFAEPAGAAGYALIIGQVPHDAACAAINFQRWARETATQLRLQGWGVRFRPHPKAPDLRCGVDMAPGDVRYQDDGGLEKAFEGAAFVVTWNSNAGVVAALAGVPVVALDVGSMAHPVASHDIAAPITMPDRLRWAQRLAWCQWLPAELADGSAWEAVRSALPNPSPEV